MDKTRPLEKNIFKCSAHTASVMFNTFWNPFLSEAELVCPQSCFLLNCLQAHCPSFLQLAPPPQPRANAGPRPWPRGKGSGKTCLGRQAAFGGDTLLLQLGGGSRPVQGGSPQRFSPAQTQQGSECTRARSAVRSKNALWSQAQKCLWQAQAQAGLQKM